MEFSKYIVPIYIGNEYYGTGFIINDMLITANHVVKNKLHAYFYFEKKRYQVKISELVVQESIGNLSPTNSAQDLFVCKIDINDKSNLVLSSEYDINQNCEFLGYSLSLDNKSIKKDYLPNIRIIRDKAFDSLGRKITNCITCECELKYTNSGGVLFQNNMIIGMLIKDMTHFKKYHESIFIKADYIKHTIEEYDSAN